MDSEGALQIEFSLYISTYDLDVLAKSKKSSNSKKQERDYRERSNEYIGVIKSHAQNYQDHSRNVDAERRRMKVLESHREIIGEVTDGTFYAIIDCRISAHARLL